MGRAMNDWPTILLAVCLLACIVAIALLVIFKGPPVIAGSGLGGLTVVLGGALAARVRQTNGHGK